MELREGRPGRSGLGLVLLVLGVAGLIVLALGGDPYVWNAGSDLVGVLIVPAIALALLAGGIITRQDGLLIGGSVLAGIGAGIVLLAGFDLGLSGTASGGVFMLAMAAGWLLILPLTAAFTRTRHLWPLIPAAVFALIAFALMSGQPERLEVLGNRYLWSGLLLALGALLLLRPSRRG